VSGLRVNDREGITTEFLLLMGGTIFLWLAYTWTISDKILLYNDNYGERWIEAAVFFLLFVASFAVVTKRWYFDN